MIFDYYARAQQVLAARFDEVVILTKSHSRYDHDIV